MRQLTAMCQLQGYGDQQRQKIDEQHNHLTSAVDAGQLPTCTRITLACRLSKRAGFPEAPPISAACSHHHYASFLHAFCWCHIEYADRVLAHLHPASATLIKRVCIHEHSGMTRCCKTSRNSSLANDTIAGSCAGCLDSEPINRASAEDKD